MTRSTPHTAHIRPTMKLENMRLARRLAKDMEEIVPPEHRHRLVALFYESLCQDEENFRKLNDEDRERGR